MARFLLIHGSCHGAWCWRDVLPLLRAGGHDAHAIDLPSHGEDNTPIHEITLDHYANAICYALEEPTILVGHSMAGYPITAAAELAPQKIAKLVYLAAYVPKPGKSLVDMRKAASTQPLMDAIITSPDRLSFTIDPAKARDKFYHDCPDEAVAFALARLGSQAIKPQATPMEPTEKSNNIEAHYILCENDRTVPPDYQKIMSAPFAPHRVHHLATSHSPFFAAPDALTDTLIQIAEAS